MATNNSVNETQTGFQSMTSTGVHNGRTITASTNIAVTNGDGISGNPTVAVTAPFAATSLTANSLILGNGASNVSALGAATNGQLPIGSTGAAPVLSTLTAGSGITITNGAGSITIASNTTPSTSSGLDFIDDFLYGMNSVVQNSSGIMLGPWTVNSTGGSSIISVGVGPSTFPVAANHPGIVKFNLSSSAGGTGRIRLNTNCTMVLGGGELTLTYFFNLPALSAAGTRWTLTFGLADSYSTTASTIPNGVFFRYTDNVNSGQWVLYTSSASTQTVTNSASTVATGWQVAQIIVNAAGTSAQFLVGTTLAGLTNIGTINTNIPTAETAIFMDLNYPTSGATSASGVVYLDEVTAQMPFTTAR